MLAVTSISGFAGLTPGTDFACTSTICFAKNATTDALFMALQRAANAFVNFFAPPMPLLTVDGFIGAATTKLLRRLDVHPLLTPTVSKEVIAQNAFDLLTALNRVINQDGSIAPTGTPTRKPGTQLPQTGSPQSSSPSPLPVAVSTLPTTPIAVAKPFYKRPEVLIAAGGGAVALLVLASLHRHR